MRVREDTFTRPDASGTRLKGLLRKTYQMGDDYPYDRPVSYGQPNVYDRGSNTGVGGLHSGPLVPKDTEHTIWDDIEEALGSPTFFQKAYSSQAGSSIPGGNSSASWARMPAHAWDDDDQEEERMERYGESPGQEVVSPDGVDREILVIQMGGNDLVSQIVSSGLLAQRSAWPFLEWVLQKGFRRT